MEPNQPSETKFEIGHLLKLAARLYPGRGMKAWTQRWRPRIAPYHLLLGELPPGSCVLDIGCGSGLFLGLLAAEGLLGQGIGFDASAAAIALAEAMKRQLPNAAASKLSFKLLDVDHDWPAGQFDVVVMIDVIHHIPKQLQRDVLLSAYRKVRPGGLFLYKDMAARPIYCGLANRLHDLVMARQWIRYLPIRQAEEWIMAEGAEVVLRGQRRMLWYQHEHRMFRRPSGVSGTPV